MRGPRKSCTVRYPGEGNPGSHAQSGILVRGPRKSCTVKYPGEGDPGSHAQSGILVRGTQGVMLSQVSL